jgi:hypothetical protein
MYKTVSSRVLDAHLQNSELREGKRSFPSHNGGSAAAVECISSLITLQQLAPARSWRPPQGPLQFCRRPLPGGRRGRTSSSR